MKLKSTSPSSKGDTKKLVDNKDEFRKLVRGVTVEAIEVTEYLNRWVIGQAVVAKHLLEIRCEVHAAVAVVVCSQRDRLLISSKTLDAVSGSYRRGTGWSLRRPPHPRTLSRNRGRGEITSRKGLAVPVPVRDPSLTTPRVTSGELRVASRDPPTAATGLLLSCAGH